MLQIFKSKAGKFIWLFAAIERDDKRAIKTIVTKKLKLLGIIVSCQSLFIGLHIQNVQIKVSLYSVL
jgi:hypothetical protein